MLIASDSNKKTRVVICDAYSFVTSLREAKADSEDLRTTKSRPTSCYGQSIKTTCWQNHPLHVVWCSMYNNTVILHVVAYETGIRQSDLLISFDQTVSLCLTATKFISKSSQVLLHVSYCFLWQASWQFLLLAASGPAFCDPYSHPTDHFQRLHEGHLKFIARISWFTGKLWWHLRANFGSLKIRILLLQSWFQSLKHVRNIKSLHTIATSTSWN